MSPPAVKRALASCASAARAAFRLMSENSWAKRIQSLVSFGRLPIISELPASTITHAAFFTASHSSVVHG